MSSTYILAAENALRIYLTTIRLWPPDVSLIHMSKSSERSCVGSGESNVGYFRVVISPCERVGATGITMAFSSHWDSILVHVASAGYGRLRLYLASSLCVFLLSLKQ